jgi:hypothetical protein
VEKITIMTSKSHPLPKQTFEALSKNRGAHSVTIYLPMDIKGKEQNERLAQTILKSCIKQAHMELKNHQLGQDEITEYLKPLESLLVNTEVWRNPSHGLAVFLDTKSIRYYLLPIRFETKVYVASDFFLKPLLPLFYENGAYYVLELSQDYTKLYEASRFSFKNLFIEDFAPDTLEKAVGADYKPKMLQVRSGQNTAGGGNFHGLGEGKDDLKKELRFFFREIDKGVLKTIKNSKIPLIIAGTDETFSLYRSVSKYANIFETNIPGDPEFKNKNKLHEESWNLIKRHFEKKQQEKVLEFKELYNTPKTGYEISEIIPAALQGKVDTLFVREDMELFGLYDMDNEQVTLDQAKKVTNGSLSNLVSVHAFLQGGSVYLMPAHKMPIPDRPLNAIYRY